MSLGRFRGAIIGVVCLATSAVAAQPAAPAEPAAPATSASAPPTEGAPTATPTGGQAQPATPASAPAKAPENAAPASTPVDEGSASDGADEGFWNGLVTRMQVHGFISEGGFISTANDYIGNSSRGSLKFLEVGLNTSIALTETLRVGMQLVFRSVGTLSEDVPRLDWGFLDYRPLDWLGLRAGVIKMPLGLYNEYVSIDAARTQILLPQSVYPLRNRDALISHTGFAAYGNISLAAAGDLSYQGWFGTLSIPRSALELAGASLNSVDTRYVTGVQTFWLTPIDGLRVGGTYLRTVIDFHLTLDADSVNELEAAKLVPPNYNGKLIIRQKPASFWVASLEYTHEDWLFAAEYSRWKTHQQTTLPMVIPTFDRDEERFYGLATYRMSSWFELGTYYSVTHADVHDRQGHGAAFAKRYYAFQRDLAGSLRFDINRYWICKLEGHYMDGAADLQATANPNAKRYWGLFLFRTTVTF